jgi:enoyl-CoA hydratase/carnithine racemase
MQLNDYAQKYRSIQFARENGVLEVVLHHNGGAAKWGSSAESLHGELGHAFIDIARDPDNKIVILTGTGDSFMDTFAPELMHSEPTITEMWTRVYDEGVDLLNNLLAIPVPMIAAVNGPAYIHAELAVLCDIVIAADHAVFADLAHTVNGVVPSDGVHVVWPMLLGPNRGRSFLLTGEIIGAEEAKRLGFVADVVPRAEVMTRAREAAAKLAKHSTPMLRYTRALLVKELRRKMFDELPSGLAHEALASMFR